MDRITFSLINQTEGSYHFLKYAVDLSVETTLLSAGPLHRIMGIIDSMSEVSNTLVKHTVTNCGSLDNNAVPRQHAMTVKNNIQQHRYLQNNNSTNSGVKR